MNNLVVIVPSRGRPENAKRLVGAFLSGGATVQFALDDDDPTLSEYEDFLEHVGDIFLRARQQREAGRVCALGNDAALHFKEGTRGHDGRRQTTYLQK